MLQILDYHTPWFDFLSAEKDKNKIGENFYSLASVVFISSIIIFLILYLFSNTLAAALFNGDVNLTRLVCVIVFVACLNSFLLNFFRTFQQMRLYSIILLLQTYLGILLVSYLIIKGYGLYIVSVGFLAANIISLIVMMVFIVLDIGLKLPNYKNTKEYLSFGIPTLPANLSSWIVDSSDRYVIGIFLGVTFVGYYSPGLYTWKYYINGNSTFGLILPTVLPKYYDANEMEKVKTFIKYSTKYFLLIAIPSAFGIINSFKFYFNDINNPLNCT